MSVSSELVWSVELEEVRPYNPTFIPCKMGLSYPGDLVRVPGALRM